MNILKKIKLNQIDKYINDIYNKIKDDRLIKAKTNINNLINKATKITGLDASKLLLLLDFKPADLTVEALEAFLAELRAIFWLNNFGFTKIVPIQASNKPQPDFIANYKEKTCSIEVFCLTQEHEQQKTKSVYINFDPNFNGSKFGRDFMSKAPEKKLQLDTYPSDLKVLLCVVNSTPIISLNTKDELYNHIKLLYTQLGWGYPYYLGLLTGVSANGIPSDAIFPILK